MSIRSGLAETERRQERPSQGTDHGMFARRNGPLFVHLSYRLAAATVE
jgi:hypothetical protein